MRVVCQSATIGMIQGSYSEPLGEASAYDAQRSHVDKTMCCSAQPRRLLLFTASKSGKSPVGTTLKQLLHIPASHALAPILFDACTVLHFEFAHRLTWHPNIPAAKQETTASRKAVCTSAAS